MKRIGFLLLGFLLAGSTVMAQNDGSGARKMSREERKAAKEAEELKQMQVVAFLIRDTSFVVVADRVEESGSMKVVNPNLNYIAVGRLDMVIQTGLDTGVGGNNLGGMTLVGKMSNLNVYESGKNGYKLLKTNFTSSTGRRLRIEMKISPTGNTMATVESNVDSFRLTYRGRIKAIEDTRIFEGRTTW
jgi:hypothetical protein